MNTTVKRTFSVVIRIIVSVCLIVWLLRKMEYSPLLGRVGQFEIVPYILGVIIMTGYVVFQGLMLGFLIRCQGQPAKGLVMVRSNFVSNFFGTFLPGGLGPDIVMGYLLSNSPARLETVIGVMLFARIGSVISMIVIAFVASLAPFCPVAGLKWILLPAVLFLLISMLILSHNRTAALFLRCRPFLVKFRPALFAGDVLGEAVRAFRTPGTMMAGIPLFLLVGVFRILIDYMGARALGLDIPVGYFFLFTPLVSLVIILPLSLAGLGLRELTYVHLLAIAGITAEDAFAQSILSFTFLLWICLVGAVIHVSDSIISSRDNHPKQQ